MAWHRHPRRWRTRFQHSLTLRLVALFLLLALALSAVFFGGTRQVFSAGWRQVVQPLLSDYVDRLAAEIGSPPDIVRARALTERLPLSVHIDGPSVNWNSHPLPADPAVDPDHPAVGSPFWLKDRRHWQPGTLPRDARTREALTRVTADGHRLRFGLGDLGPTQHPQPMVWGLVATLLVLLALAFALVRRLFRPLDDIRAGALRYGQGRFDQPIPVRRRDELGELAGHVNQMASSLQRMLEGQRGLLLAISHELRSPLTRARLNAEMVAEGPERDALLRDLAQMRDLIADLLESERLAGGAAALQPVPTDLNRLVRELVAAQFPDRDIALHLAPELAPVAVDPPRLQLLLRNLLDNALRHGGNDIAPPEVRTETRPDGGWRLTVRDHGPGASAQQLARLGEPFFRPDTARTRRAGGVGLGLYLCRLVAESHGGRLALSNAAPGLQACVDVPGQAGPDGFTNQK